MAAVALLFTACKKDEEQTQDNNNPNQEQTLENNTLVYEGITYHLQSRAWVEDYGQMQDHYLVTMSDGTDGVHELYVSLGAENLNQSFDLTKPYQDAEFTFSFVLEQTSISFSQYESSFSGYIDGTNYEDGSIFTTGTFTCQFNDSGLTFSIDGTLINGKDLAFKVFVPKNELNPDHK